MYKGSHFMIDNYFGTSLIFSGGLFIRADEYTAMENALRLSMISSQRTFQLRVDVEGRSLSCQFPFPSPISLTLPLTEWGATIGQKNLGAGHLSSMQVTYLPPHLLILQDP